MYKINLKTMYKLSNAIVEGAHYLDVFELAYTSIECKTTVADERRFCSKRVKPETGMVWLNMMFEDIKTLNK